MAIFTSADLERYELQRRTQAGSLQRLAAGIFSDDVLRTAEEVVQREWREIVAKVMPGAVVSYASAFTATPTDGELNVSHRRRNPLLLPGLTVRPDAAGRREADDIPIRSGLFLASPVRALIDNSEDHPGRPNRRIRRLTREQLHDQIVQLVQTTSPDRIERLMQEVVRRSPTAVGAGLAAFVAAAQARINTVDTPSRAMRAAQRREGYDRQRVELFRDFAGQLAAKAPIDRPDLLPGLTAELPFFEAYFSNFIEGTEFTLDEAEQIVFEGADLGRPADAHDITGTFKVTSAAEMRLAPHDADEFLERLREHHAVLMEGRPHNQPGQWKQRANRAGATEFVAPELVPGTLRAGWEEGQRLDAPFRRAVYLMFLVAEVHPFIDGNGRTARITMNNELVAAGQHRIVVPTIIRNEYISSLTRATNRGGPDALYSVLDHAQHWVTQGDWSTITTGTRYVQDTNAAIDPRQADQQRIYLEIPRWSPLPRDS